MTELARFALALTIAAPFALAGCESGGRAADVHSYVDSSGRSCTVDANDISGTATCDASAAALVSCTSGTEAGFVLNDDYDFMTHVWTLESCAGCIDRPNHMTTIQSTSCATITCTADMDCIHSAYTCMSGVCRHL